MQKSKPSHGGSRKKSAEVLAKSIGGPCIFGSDIPILVSRFKHRTMKNQHWDFGPDDEDEDDFDFDFEEDDLDGDDEESDW
jgi:hypothetical protein